MDIPQHLEAEFNRIYDEDHVPTILKVPGVRSCARYRLEHSRITAKARSLAMHSKVPGVRSAARYRLEHSTVPGMQRYLTIYELDSPDVLKSAAWEKAGAYGDWATKIRPLTTSRHHSVFERIA